MKKLTKSEKRLKLEMVEVNSEKIIFQTIYPWAFCLNAKQANRLKHYFLPTNPLNIQKLQKIVLNYDLLSNITNVSSIDIQPPQLRDYQLADVKFLSQLKSVAIFSEMRTGKTPTALMTFKQWPDTFKIDSSYFKKLKKNQAVNIPYCVIVDEAHFLRNHQSQQSKSIYILKDAPFKMALTGTPVVNRSPDIFGILKFLDPETYSSY
ncbi:9966_t:CDS:2 [Ambispora leptoticha]|uniref:9966_t:CDS:1 n=1 Tax=Ambispora leptoticha TaxID=144679 RepID=A0A9N9HF77_9GLOM|nr:9966_t:CDS:2 [Ambispora leptoticha]